jgi:hypothetical protein
MKSSFRRVPETLGRPALGLSARFILIVAGIALAGVSVSSVLVLGLERQQALANVEATDARLVRGIEAA